MATLHFIKKNIYNKIFYFHSNYICIKIGKGDYLKINLDIHKRNNQNISVVLIL